MHMVIHPPEAGLDAVMDIEKRCVIRHCYFTDNWRIALLKGQSDPVCAEVCVFGMQFVSSQYFKSVSYHGEVFVVIDCRDSFIYNVVASLGSLGVDVRVESESDLDTDVVRSLDPDAIVLSPGPGRPSPNRGSWKVLDEFREDTPILGICLGHQAVCSYFGMTVDEGKGPMHGKVTLVHHSGNGLLNGIPDGFRAVRYNSLSATASTVPDCLTIDATDDRGDVMAVSHRSLPIFGVQFHPESFLSEHGDEIFRNFLKEVRS